MDVRSGVSVAAQHEEVSLFAERDERLALAASGSLDWTIEPEWPHEFADLGGVFEPEDVSKLVARRVEHLLVVHQRSGGSVCAER